MKIIFTIILIFFGFFTNNVFAEENTENTNQVTNYFLVDDINSKLELKGGEKKAITFTNGQTLFGTASYFFSDNAGVNYVVESSGEINALTESSFRKIPYSYRGENVSYNYGNNLYFLETKDFVIKVKQNEIGYNIYNNGKAEISIYSKKYRDFFTINTDIWLTDLEETKFINIGDGNRKRQLLNNISIKNNVLTIAEVVDVGGGKNAKGFIKYTLDLENIPEDYFNGFFEYRMVLQYAKTPFFENKYLEDVLKGERSFDFQDYILLGPDNFFPLFYKTDTTDFLNSDDLIGVNGEKFFSVKKIMGINLGNYVDENSGIGGTPFITLKNNGFAIIKNNYILYNKDNDKIGFIYYNGSIYENKYIGGTLDNFLYNYNSLRFYYLPKSKEYVLSFIKNRSGILTGHTVVVNEEKLYNLENARLYDGIYYVGQNSKGQLVFVTNNLLNKYREGITSYNFFYSLADYNGKTYLVKSTDGYGRLSDQPVFEEPLGFNLNNNGFYIDPVTGEVNDNAGNTNADGGYTDDNYTREKEREKEEFENFKKDEKIIDKIVNFVFSPIPFFVKIFDYLSLGFSFPEDYSKRLRIPILYTSIENGQAKINYKAQETELKPIEDKLNISNVGDGGDLQKKVISTFLAFLYFIIRTIIFCLSFFIIYFSFNYLNRFSKFLFGDLLTSYGTSNVLGGVALVTFLGSLFVFITTFYGTYSVIFPFFTQIINLVNLIFGFINENFFDFLFFKQITTLLTTITGLGIGFIGVKLAFKFGKIF